MDKSTYLRHKVRIIKDAIEGTFDGFLCFWEPFNDCFFYVVVRAKIVVNSTLFVKGACKCKEKKDNTNFY